MANSPVKLFDSHFHIIDNRYPLIRNNGYLPEPYLDQDYLNETADYQLIGGAVVSGSFQGFDQAYLTQALAGLGDGFVGVTQLPATVTDGEILELNQQGVRAVRFNLKRGGSADVKHLASMASRVYELANWHVELYVDSSMLDDLFATLVQLPSVSIDHLGLSKVGFNTLCRLVEKEVKVKATGFSRVDFDVESAIRQLHGINPYSLMFGTDLPSTRAPRRYSDDDRLRLVNCLEPDALMAVLYGNASSFYRIDS
ncbi:MAG: amidohydrolase family protein [Kangiellaceae bacterium]|nr:amidohydrolase family protein [Kangiellaceae bacterium]